VRAGPYLLGLITLSAVTATLGARAFQAMMSRRRAHETLV
jgi:hypothetical protein